MRFAVSCAVIPASAPVSELVDYVRLAERSGMRFVTGGDIVTRNFELNVLMTMLAAHSETIGILSTITNPVTRHPSVVAAAWASLAKISGGRAVMGIGTGNSAVRNIGLEPATLADLREHVETVRALIRAGRATYRGAELNLPWAPEVVPDGVPVYLAADGPKALALAGEIADGVVVGGGISRPYVEEVYAALDRGARIAGRRVADIDIWFGCDVSFAESRQAAIGASLDMLGALCSGTFRPGFTGKAVPEELQSQVRTLNERYDYSQHATGGNGQLIAELGLADFLADRFLVAGTADEIAARLEEAAGYGVGQILIPNFCADPGGFLRRFHAEVLPRVAGIKARSPAR